MIRYQTFFKLDRKPNITSFSFAMNYTYMGHQTLVLFQPPPWDQLQIGANLKMFDQQGCYFQECIDYFALTLNLIYHVTLKQIAWTKSLTLLQVIGPYTMAAPLQIDTDLSIATISKPSCSPRISVIYSECFSQYFTFKFLFETTLELHLKVFAYKQINPSPVLKCL